MLNLGLRYDFYSNMVARPTGEVPVGFYNLAPPKDWNKFDFGRAARSQTPLQQRCVGQPWAAASGSLTAWTTAAKQSCAAVSAFSIARRCPAWCGRRWRIPIVPFRVSWSLDEARALA